MFKIIFLICLIINNSFALKDIEIKEKECIYISMKIENIFKEAQDFNKANEIISYANALEQLQYHIKEYLKCIDSVIVDGKKTI